MTDMQTQTQASALLDELLESANLGPDDQQAKEQYSSGLRQFLEDFARQQKTATPKVDKSRVDGLIADIDRRLSAQVNEIMHAPEVQGLEGAWRGLKYLVDQINFRENVRLDLVNLSKEDLKNDFEDAPDITKSGLYKLVYRSAYGVFGGKPYGVISSNYDFGPGTEDIQVLGKCAAVGAMAHTPFLANASPRMFGTDSFTELPRLKDLKVLFEGPQYARWSSFRDTEDARYVGLCMPRFLLRAPYGKRESELKVKAFDFTEEVIDHHDRYLWGPASYAMTARVADSFAKYRWCPNIIGPQGGGAVHQLPLHQYEQGGELRTKNPCEVQLEDVHEFQLSEEGFVGLVCRQGSDNGAFFSANSTQRPKIFPKTPEGFVAQTNSVFGTRLPYVFIVSRLAHYMKVMQREQIGTWKTAKDLQSELQKWIRQYVTEMPDPTPDVRARRPLRAAAIDVTEIEGQVGWYRCSLRVAPHVKYEGVDITLSLVGKLDAEKK
jgi:type VI secretion system protein ImpC